MAKKSDRISVNEIEKVLKETNDVAELDWKGLRLKVKGHLSLDEMRAIVIGVVSSCFNNEGGYQPEVKEFATRAFAIVLYTNIALPKNLNTQYEVVYGSGIWEAIFDYIDFDQYISMVDAIDERLKSILKVNIEEFNKQRAEFEDSTNKIKEIFDGIDPQDIDNMLSALTNMNITEEGLMQAFLKSKDGEEDQNG